MQNNSAFNNIYHNKKVFVTGHCGFKGCWLVMLLKKLGAKVYGYSLKPDSTESLYDIVHIHDLLEDEMIADIREREILAQFPLVRLSYAEPVLTYETNVIGTLNVLEAARQTASVKAFVNVTTDKCYENKEKSEGYKEDEPMGGYDMYSSSKGCSEILSSSYRRSFLADGKPFALGTGRAGNVIGGGDWAKDRLIPDCINAIRKGETIFIRNPLATRPWHFVLEPLVGYLRLGQMLFEQGAKYADGFNFGPYASSVVKVCEVAQKVVNVWGNGKVEVGSSDGLHEATLLQLNIEKADKVLGVRPVYDVDAAIKVTTEWYKQHYTTQTNMYDFSQKQIDEFLSEAKKQNLEWSL